MATDVTSSEATSWCGGAACRPAQHCSVAVPGRGYQTWSQLTEQLLRVSDEQPEELSLGSVQMHILSQCFFALFQVC